MLTFMTSGFTAELTSGFTAELGEHDKHSNNDVHCTEHEWMDVSHEVLVVGGMKQKNYFSRVAKKLATQSKRF